MLRQAGTLSTAASEEKQALASHTVASTDATLQKCKIASKSPYIFFLEADFNGAAGLKLAGKSVPVIISPGFATMSFFRGLMVAINSLFSFYGTMNSSSVFTRSYATALNSSSVTAMFLWAFFMFLPLYFTPGQ